MADKKNNFKTFDLVDLSKEDLKSMCINYLNSENLDLENFLTSYISISKINKNTIIEIEILKKELSIANNEIKSLKEVNKIINNKLDYINMVEFQQTSFKLDNNLNKQKESQHNYNKQKENLILIENKVKELEKEIVNLNKKYKKRKKVVLSVHKSELMLLLFQKKLIGSEFELITSKDGEEAKSIFLEMTPDIVITEIGLTSLNGLDFSRWIKSNIHTKDTPVILIVGQKDGIKERLDLSLADSFLIKGEFDDKLLKETIAKYTDKK